MTRPPCNEGVVFDRAAVLPALSPEQERQIARQCRVHCHARYTMDLVLSPGARLSDFLVLPSVMRPELMTSIVLARRVCPRRDERPWANSPLPGQRREASSPRWIHRDAVLSPCWGLEQPITPSAEAWISSHRALPEQCCDGDAAGRCLRLPTRPTE